MVEISFLHFFQSESFWKFGEWHRHKLSESISVTLLYSTLIIFTPFSITVGDIPCSNKVLFDQNHIVSPGIVSYGPSTSMTHIQNSHLQNESRYIGLLWTPIFFALTSGMISRHHPNRGCTLDRPRTGSARACKFCQVCVLQFLHLVYIQSHKNICGYSFSTFLQECLARFKVKFYEVVRIRLGFGRRLLTPGRSWFRLYFHYQLSEFFVTLCKSYVCILECFASLSIRAWWRRLLIISFCIPEVLISKNLSIQWSDTVDSIAFRKYALCLFSSFVWSIIIPQSLRLYICLHTFFPFCFPFFCLCSRSVILKTHRILKISSTVSTPLPFRYFARALATAGTACRTNMLHFITIPFQTSSAEPTLFQEGGHWSNNREMVIIVIQK